MARYVIVFRSGNKIHADDARANGAFVEYITKDIHRAFAVPYTDIERVEAETSGGEGGYRFGGQPDPSFAPSPGSVGGAFTGPS